MSVAGNDKSRENDTPPRRGGRRRASRIPLDYYKSRDNLGRWKLSLVSLAPLAVLVWGVFHLLNNRSLDQTANHGPVWVGHRVWENDCEACHVPFHPIKSEVALASMMREQLMESDAKCEVCHPGPVHHENQRQRLVESCAGCHRDHQGRDFDLNRVPDGQCTNCHSNLQEAIKPDLDPSSVLFDNITRFDRDHPDFAVRVPSLDGRGPLFGRLTADPNQVLATNSTAPEFNRIKFNHKLHMASGLGQEKYSFAKLKEEDRPYYGWTEGTPLNTLIQLDCNSCHVLDGGDFPPQNGSLAGTTTVANHPPQSSGSYYLPISFDNHCQACHQLTVATPDFADDPIEVPHRLQPSEIRTILERGAAAQVLKDQPSLRNRELVDLGEGPNDNDDPTAIADQLLRSRATAELGTQRSFTSIGVEIDSIVKQAEMTLYASNQTCRECHWFDEPSDDPFDWSVRAAIVPEIWFPHSSFAHDAHRAVDCNECHGGVESSEQSFGIYMPSIETCKECHAPEQKKGGRIVAGGVRFDCVECHRYHNGVRPQQGIGALARQVESDRLRTIKAFLRNEPIISSEQNKLDLDAE